jgi:hypothetical protein
LAQKLDKQTDIAAALKEQLALITFLVLFAGLVATDTYYAGFGIRYQVMEFSLTHLVYRGLTAVIDGPWLITAYLIAIGWLAGGSAWLTARGPRWTNWVQIITYSLIIVLVAVAYFAAIAAGANAANRDLSAQTSQLPVIREIKAKDGTVLPYAGYRLLFASKDSVILFKAAASSSESPFIHQLKRDDTGEITFTR